MKIIFNNNEFYFFNDRYLNGKEKNIQIIN